MAMNSIIRWTPRLAYAVTGLLLLSAATLAQEAGDGLDAAATSALDRGQQALQDEDYDAARKAFTEAILTSPTDPRAYIGRARALVGLELQQEALSDFKTAMDYTNSPNETAKQLRAATQFYRGKMYLDLGDQFVGAALPDLQAAYDSDRENLEYVFALGKAYSIAGAGLRAEPLLTEYLEQNPDDAEGLRLRGAAYATMGDQEKAVADLNRAIELNPDDHLNYLTLASLYVAKEDYEPCIDLLQKSIDNYEPEEGQEDLPFAQGYLTLALIYEELGKQAEELEEQQANYTKCVETCDKLLGLLPEENQTAPSRAAALFRKGVSHRLLKEYSKAIEALTETINLNPEMGEAYYRRAICFAEMGENKLALRDLKDTQALNFEDARSFLWQGIVHAQLGEYRQAIRSYNEAIALSNRYVDAYLNRAHSYFQLAEYEAAIDSFNECIRLQPSAAPYYFRRGLCYHNLDELDEAVQSYINAIQFDEGYLPAYDYLIPALEELGQQDLANRYREKRASLSTNEQPREIGATKPRLESESVSLKLRQPSPRDPAPCDQRLHLYTTGKSY